MIGKLLKYDLRAMWRQFSLIWAAALALALANRFTLNRQGGGSNNLMLMALAAVFAAMFIISLLAVIQRFNQGLLGDEGYLMHTLPVRSWELVLSKLVCAIVTCVGSGLAALLSLVLMSTVNWLFRLDFGMLFRGLLKYPDTVLLLLEFCLLTLSALVIFISTMYLAMSVGHLFPRCRGLVSVAVFIGLYVMLGNFYAHAVSLHVIQALVDMTTSNVHGSMLTISAAMLIPAAAFLAGVSWILENKLNLE